MGGQYSNVRPEMARIISECAELERERILAAPGCDIPTERCIDGRYISIDQKKLAYKTLDEVLLPLESRVMHKCEPEYAGRAENEDGYGAAVTYCIECYLLR